MGYFTFHDCDFRLVAPNRAFRHFELCLSEQFGLRAYMNGGWYSITPAEKYLQEHGLVTHLRMALIPIQYTMMAEVNLAQKITQ